MKHGGGNMAHYRVYVKETNLVVYYVDADSPEEAEEIYWDDFGYKHLSCDESEVIEVEEQT
jgi:hypothetical protein